MKKITRYTSIDELKASKDSSRPTQSAEERGADIAKFITVLKNNTMTSNQSLSDKPLNKLTRGK